MNWRAKKQADKARVRDLNAWIATAAKLQTAGEFRKALKDLPSIWSRESVLQGLLMIRLLELFESRQQATKRKRPQNAWQRFASKEMKGKGGGMKILLANLVIRAALAFGAPALFFAG